MILDSFWFYFVNTSDPHGRFYIEDEEMNMIAQGVSEETAKYICELHNFQVRKLVMGQE